MDERCRLQGVVVPLGGHSSYCYFAKFLISKREKSFKTPLISGFDVRKNLRDVRHKRSLYGLLKFESDAARIICA